MTRTHYVIGRSSSADIRLEDLAVSRRHAEVFSDDSGQWWIRDLHSSVGTSINGAAVTLSRLSGGEEIRLGGSRVRFCRGSDSRMLRPGASAWLESRVDVAPCVTSLGDLGAPKLSAANLRELDAFGTSLSEVKSSRTRYELLCEHVVRQLGHSVTARVLRIDPRNSAGNAEVLATRESTPGKASRADYISRGVLRRIAEVREPLLASNSPLTMSDTPVSVVGSPLAVLAAPLGNNSATQELLYVTSPRLELANAEWLALTALAASQCRQADVAWQLHERLRQHELIEKDLKRAREMQSRLIPSPTPIPGVDWACSVQPCRWVGGDYLDIPVIGAERMRVCVGDVSGKGMPAALLTGNLHAMFRAAAAGAADLPTQVRQANDYLCRHLPDDAFVTLLALDLDPRDGSIEYVCAGHPTPIVISPESARWLTGPRAIPLGVDPIDPTPVRSRLSPGEWLVLHTDGVTETASPSRELFGEERLLQTLSEIAAAGPADAASFLSRLWETLDRFQGPNEPADDRTCLVLRLTAR
ncbi:MAG: SpoIIE family protein phosphatase [Planctomycetes bacterium]|nr:SpoIIE family protein phosphatase [Planctomycetota bacterium]